MATKFFTDIHLTANKVGRDADNLIDFSTDNNVVFRVNGVNEIELAENVFRPSTHDGIGLGLTSYRWSDLWLASGAIIDFGVASTPDVTLTHSSNLLTLTGGGLTVGVDDTGHDVKFFGATSGSYLLWNESHDRLELTDDVKIMFGDSNDFVIHHDGSNTYLTQQNNKTGDIIIRQSTDDANIKLQSDDGSGGTTSYLTVDGTNHKVVINAASGLMIGNAFTFPTGDGSANQVLQTNGSGAVTWEDASGGGSGSMTTVKNGGSQVGGADIVTLDFGTGITATESPDTEINIALDAAQTVITSLLAADIKIGEDNETKIDFETADEIHFYAANAEQVYVADGIFGPQTDSDVDLGSGSVRWKDGYFDSITTTGLTVASSTSAEPVVLIQNRTNDATSATLKLESARGGVDAQDEDLLGKIEFWGYDDGTPSVQQYANIKAEIRDASDGAEEGKLYMQVASHDGEMVTGMAIQSGNLEDEVDVIIGNGSSSTVTIKGSLVIGSTTLPSSALQGQITARTIGGVSFDGSADIDLPGVNAVGNQNTSGSAATLTTSRNFQTDLGSTSAAGFTGAAACSPGVTGTLAVGNGGTGVTTMTNLKNALDDETWTFANAATFTGNITANGNIIGDDSTNITNIQNIDCDAIRADGDSTTGITLAASDVNIIDGNENSMIRVQDDEVDINGAATITTRKFAKTSNTDGSYNGDVVFFGSTTSMTTGAIYHFKSDGTWELADADSAANCDGMLGVALGSASNTNGVLLRGFVTLDHDPGAVGDVLFLSTTAGDCAASAPAGNGDIIRVVGYCIDASNGQIYFNPDGTYVEVSA